MLSCIGARKWILKGLQKRGGDREKVPFTLAGNCKMDRSKDGTAGAAIFPLSWHWGHDGGPGTVGLPSRWLHM